MHGSDPLQGRSCCPSFQELCGWTACKPLRVSHLLWVAALLVLPSSDVVLNGVILPIPGDIRHCLEPVLVVTTGEGAMLASTGLRTGMRPTTYNAETTPQQRMVSPRCPQCEAEPPCDD